MFVRLVEKRSFQASMSVEINLIVCHFFQPLSLVLIAAAPPHLPDAVTGLYVQDIIEARGPYNYVPQSTVDSYH